MWSFYAVKEVKREINKNNLLIDFHFRWRNKVDAISVRAKRVLLDFYYPKIKNK